MDTSQSFKFLDSQLNRRLLDILKKRRDAFVVDAGGAVRMSPENEIVLHNEILPDLRAEKFASWQLITCPEDWIESYKEYMATNAVPFTEEIENGDLWFMIPGSYKPHSWKIKEPTRDQATRKR